MNEEGAETALNLTLSESAKVYLQKYLPFAAEMSRRGLVASLTYSGGMAHDVDGEVLWDYRGPNFVLAGAKPKPADAGGYFDLLGVRVWIGKTERTLLRGKTLTTIWYGNPHPEELLVIENAPPDYFERTMFGAGCAQDGNVKG